MEAGPGRDGRGVEEAGGGAWAPVPEIEAGPVLGGQGLPTPSPSCVTRSRPSGQMGSSWVFSERGTKNQNWNCFTSELFTLREPKISSLGFFFFPLSINVEFHRCQRSREKAGVLQDTANLFIKAKGLWSQGGPGKGVAALGRWGLRGRGGEIPVHS